MRFPGIRLSLPALATALALAASGPAIAKNNTGAVIGGIIAGAAIGAAISSAIDQPKKIYVPTPPPPRPPGPNPWANAFSPDPRVTCYPVQQACYRQDGAYAPLWTTRVFGR